MSYTVTRHTHGIVIMGSVPVSDMVALTREWADQEWNSFEIIDALISGHLGASMVVTTKAGSVAWRKELGIREPGGLVLQVEADDRDQ